MKYRAVKISTKKLQPQIKHYRRQDRQNRLILSQEVIFPNVLNCAIRDTAAVKIENPGDMHRSFSL